LTKCGRNKSKCDLAYKKPFSVREKDIKSYKRVRRRLCALSLVCVFIWLCKCRASGLFSCFESN